MVTTGAPVPALFVFMPLLSLPYYGGVATDGRAKQAGPECATIINLLRGFDATVQWEYALALVRTIAAEAHQKHRIPVWPGAVINFSRLRGTFLSNKERANMFWKPLFNLFLLNLEKPSYRLSEGRVSEIPHLAPAPMDWVCMAYLSVPAAMSDLGDTGTTIRSVRFSRQMPPPPPVPVQVVHFRPETPPILPLSSQRGSASVSIAS